MATPAIITSSSSFAARAIAFALGVAGVKRSLFNPEQFVGPKAKPRKAGAHLPPRSVRRAVDIESRAFAG